MELKEEIEFEQLLETIRQLPDDKKLQIQAELSSPKKTEDIKDDFLQFLLNGPVMSDERYKEYLDARNHFNKWRTK